ncbi:hypothetical protein [Tichowtungia aerotolerans]|uniref:Uncharacterized protein n=1 Tax=Tichowtungia aerotolerans TaxID=2697043 RepID=A0A6P1M5H0_9BACT|nr:hypothetical protein [Tichowtungia aerotolerans]QHI69292.1 hypothetical protein GT409_07460 [Tichowtungia aerotolerans]
MNNEQVCLGGEFATLTNNGSMLCRGENTDVPPVREGQIGLRHMFARSARYRDFEVFVRN